LSIYTSMGSVSLSVHSERQRRSISPEIAWGSDVFSRGSRDAQPCSPARRDSHTFPESYRMLRPSLCTESEAEPFCLRSCSRFSRTASGVGSNNPEAETLGGDCRPKREHGRPVDFNPVMHAIVHLLGRRHSFLYFQIGGASTACLETSCRESFDDQR
jgi:hypothetical protein